MATQTELIRRGLVLDGWKRVQARSGRECYSKTTELRNRSTGERRMAPYFVYLGTAASLRGCSRDCFTDSRVVGELFRTKMLNLGRTVSEAELQRRMAAPPSSTVPAAAGIRESLAC